MTYGNSNGTHVKNKNKTGTVATKKCISTLNKLPQNIMLPQPHSQKEEHGSVSLLKVWLLTIPKRKQNTENKGTSVHSDMAIQTQKLWPWSIFKKS